jgi:hypothetical protein
MRDDGGRRRFGPSEWIAAASALLGFGSVVIAVVSLSQSSTTARDQQDLQAEVEERQSAPLLVPGVEQEMRLKRRRFQIVGSHRQVVKLANFLRIYWDPGAPELEPYIVVPMRNAGEAVAIVLDEEARLVRDCDNARRRRLGRSGVERLGFYVIRPGESEQLYYAPRGSDAVRVAEEYRAASDEEEVSVLVRYTDQLGLKIRWTCVTYTRDGSNDEYWSVSKPVYGERANPNQEELVVTSEDEPPEPQRGLLPMP